MSEIWKNDSKWPRVKPPSPLGERGVDDARDRDDAGNATQEGRDRERDRDDDHFAAFASSAALA